MTRAPLARTAPLALAAALALTDVARADDPVQPTIDITFEDPDTLTPALEDQPINASFKVFLDYTLPQGHYQGVALVLTLPSRLTHPAITYQSEVSSDAFTFAYATNGRVDTLTWSAAAFDTAISGRITVTARFESNSYYYDWIDNVSRFATTLTGTAAPFSATWSGLRSDVATGPFTGFSASDVATRTAVGVAEPHLDYAGATFYGSHPLTVAGVPGVVKRYDFRMTVGGNAGVRGYDWTTGEGGIPWTLTLGSDAHLLRVWAGAQSGFPEHATPSTPASPTISILEAPIPYGQPGHTSGGVIRARVDRALTPTATWIDYSSDFFVDLFVPCDGANALIEATEADQIANRISITIGDALQRVWDDPNVAGAPADLPRAATPSSGHSGAWEIPACGTGGGLAKYWSDTTAANATVTWDTVLGPPIGIGQIDDALVIDLLPTGIDDVLAYPVAGTTMGDFLIYYCDLPGLDWFDIDQFDDFVDAGSCAPADFANYYAVPPAAMGLPTHLVYHAETWGTSELTSPQKADFYVVTHVRADYTSAVYGSIHMNRSQFQGSYDGVTLGNALLQEPPLPPDYVDPDRWEGYAIRTITDWGCGGVMLPDAQPPLHELQPGACSWLVFRAVGREALEPPENPVFEIDVPDGVEIRKPASGSPFPAEPAPVDGVWAAGSCLGGTGTILEPSPGDRPLVFRLGTPASPCSVSPQVIFDLRVELCLRDDHPWTNGEAITFDARYIGAANQGTAAQCPPSPTYPTAASVGFTVVVPPELSYIVFPTCDVEGGPAFTARAENTGGEDLSGVALTLRIPKAASGSGVDSVFAGVDEVTGATPGAIVEVSTQDPPTTWIPTSAMAGAGVAPSDVLWVRLVDPVAPGITIPALGGAPVSMRVRLTATGPGAELLTEGHARADQLGSPAPAAPPSFMLGSCGWVRVHKFLDLDGDGLDDAEPGLRDWSFVVRNPRDAEVATGSTDSSGDVAFYLPGGVYAVTELVPSSPSGPTFAPTTPPGGASLTQVAAVVMGGDDVELAFGNACTCPDTDQDACTSARCELAAEPGGPSVVCAAEEADSCDDGERCTIDACDHEGTGQCTHTPVACELVPYYIPVADASGAIAGHVVCHLTAGAPPSCMLDGLGRLRVWPLGSGPDGATCDLPGAPR